MRKVILTCTGWSLGTKCTNAVLIASKDGGAVVPSLQDAGLGFLAKPAKVPLYNCVDEALKSRKRIYELPRSELEVRVNNYNPLLLMLWKTNIDIQYVAESSLALAHYVSGYVTKAEKVTCKTSGRKLVIV